MDLSEARKNLEVCLGEELRKQYFELFRRWFSFKSPMNRQEFGTEFRKLLTSEEQIRCHNYFILALLSDKSPRTKTHRTTTDKGVFEPCNFSDYVQPVSPSMLPPREYENRSAASELFVPDSGFISSRIVVTSWQNELEGAEDSVTELVVHACQVFVKNIITAMISRLKGYKVRDGKFQYGFNLPVPDPFIRNYGNVLDETQELKTEVMEGEDSFIPRSKPSLENAEQQAAFAYSCAKRKRSEGVLSVRLLYETLKENPQILGMHELYSVNLLKLGLQLDDV